MVRVSLIIPLLNEGTQLQSLQESLGRFPRQQLELIAVDGGSVDDTPTRVAAFVDQVISAPKGRASQMNAGAAVASGDVLLFLHADTRLPDNFLSVLKNNFLPSAKCWGRFDVQLSGRHLAFRVISSFMNGRSRLTGIATGDQAMFMRRDAFQQVGGFPAIVLMEDIALSKNLKQISPPFCSREKVITSSRKWQVNGIVATVLLMWRLRLAYFFGASPERLAKIYYGS